MGWFDEQIKQRKRNDDEIFSEAFVGIADAVLGSRLASAYSTADKQAEDAIGEILKYYHVKPREVPASVKGLNDRLEFLLRPYGIMRRSVKLEKGWYQDAIGAMLTTRKDDGTIVALIPKGLRGYVYFESSTGKWVTLTQKNETLFDEEGICFYKPFPLKKLTIPALLRYVLDCLSPADLSLVALATLAVSLVGLLMPKLNDLLFGTVVESGQLRLLIGIAVFLASAGISRLLLNATKALVVERVNTKIHLSVQAAAMMRILSLPADFFKQYSSGDLASRTGYLQSLCSMLVSAVLNTGLTSVFSLLYISQIFVYAPMLVVPALSITLATLVFTLVTTFCQMKLTRQQMELASKESGMTYALITGIQKIKLSGAEKRAFARWAEIFSRRLALTADPPMFLRANAAISAAISLAGTIIMYYFALKSGISVAEYYAFNTAYGMLSGAFLSLAGIASTVARLKPVLDMAKPLMDTVPEVSEGKVVIDRLSGGIELNNVSFRYNESMPMVIDDLSLKIRPGQYVAIVGATGCGKSTLMRLLLGFEKPQKGAVYYDGKDLNAIDLRSLRRKIGVVMQDGKLFQGDIFSNITISAPQLTLKEAWEAAEMAGVAEDIRAMPMGMHTVISEGSGGISGGQRQRLMIARAIAPKPKILMFDEATSALDNLTQKTVSDSLDKLKCTRIVIAHRLSTIRHCDRILYLEKGKILEDGTYEQLIAKGGKFADLVERQRLDT